MEMRELTELQVDALKEIGNIGTGNAATALSQLLARKVDMEVPEVRVVPLAEVSSLVGGAQNYVFLVYMPVQGDVSGNMLFILGEEVASRLVDMLIENKEAFDKPPIHFEMGRSVVREVATILCGSYLTAITQATNLLMVSTAPALASDMAGAVLDFILIEIGEVSDEILFIKTDFSVQEEKLKGWLLFLPTPGSLEKILSSLGVA